MLKKQETVKMPIIKKDDRTSSKNQAGKEQQKDLFKVEEIKIEEMAIDGICGVY